MRAARASFVTAIGFTVWLAISEAAVEAWDVCPDHGQCGGTAMSSAYTLPLDLMQSLCMQTPSCTSVECNTATSPVLCKGYTRGPAEPLCDEPETDDLVCYGPAPYHERTVATIAPNSAPTAEPTRARSDYDN